MRIHSRLTAGFSALALAALSGASLADGEHLDIWVYHQDGTFQIGGISEDRLETFAGVRVFGAEFGGAGIPNLADEPGMQAPDGSFAPGERIRLNIARALRVWNGVDFLTTATPTISVVFGPESFESPATDSFTPGFDLAMDGEGGLHDHPSYILNNPADGIYLLEIVLSSPTGAFGSSPPFWIVFNNTMDEHGHELAIRWVEENLVPAPGVTGLPLGVVLFATRRRRA
ncbi:MAG: hypothetical protein HRU70_05115 [Phycisphaeraceae bacterium]|nr:MAG: hypothetical protein HRU70_05115 [Phycisphaeraceae bacterium]